MVSVPRRHAGDPDVIGQTAALVGFLREVVQSSHQRLRDTRPWGPFWLADLPAKVPRPSGDDDRPLLLLDHVPQTAAPELPPVLEGWVDERLCQDADAEDPPLAEEGPLRTWLPRAGDGDRWQDSETTVERENAEEVLRAYGLWLGRWRLWAERERAERSQRELYERIYHWHQQLVQQDDQFELVLAIGLLSWSEPNGGVIHRHVFSRRVETHVDRRTARVTVRLTSDGAVRLEDRDFLDTDDGWAPERSAAFEEELSARPFHLLTEEAVEWLSQWQDLVLPRPAAFSSNWRPPVAPDAGARLTYAPALLLRPRDRNAVLGFYDRIAEAVVSERQAPLGLAQLVMPLNPDDRKNWGGDQPQLLFEDEPLFPGKTNAQQRSVLDRLQRDTGVVVQGPPGTGKTHTIANLVSALLAQGQRVLVTSAKDQPLTVLRDKLPPAVRDLCVLLLSSTSQDGGNELERTINALSDQVAAGDTTQLKDEIQRLTQRRYEVRSRIKLLTEQVIALREAELYQHPEVAPGYSGTLAAIVQKTQDEAVKLNWIGRLPDRAPMAPPLSSIEAEELLVLLREGAGEGAESAVFPAAETLPTPGQVAAAFAASQLSVVGLSPAAVELWNRLAALDTTVTDRLAALLGTARSRLHRLGVPPEASGWNDENWVMRALTDRLGRRCPELWQRVRDVAPVLSDVTDGLDHFGLRVVVLPEALTSEQAHRMAATVPALMDQLVAGKPLRTRFASKAQRAAEELLTTCRVDGKPPVSAEDLAAVGAHLQAHKALSVVVGRWAQVGLPVAEASLEVRLAALRERYRYLTEIDAFGMVREQIDELLVNHGTYLDLTRPQAWQHFSEAAFALVGRQRAEEALARLARWEEMLRAGGDGRAPAEATAMAEALVARDADRYAKEFEALLNAQRKDQRRRRCAELIEALRTASPVLATRLCTEADDPMWDGRVGRLADAWAWAKACQFVDDERAPGREQRLDGELTEHEAKLEELTGDLAAAKGRLHCLVRMTAEQRSALQAYRTHMASYGKGKGKNASHFKAAARSAMNIAQGAVPAWVMPIARVAEMIRPKPDSFDVVIVDEASQAGMDALFLLWLAPRIIVVGDDKQCTPPITGYGRTQQIQDRLTAHLPEVPAHLRQLYMPHSNLYQLLSALFPSTIRLQEHFRCMPEIIGWSSETFYTPPGLVPLRQYGGERLEPLMTHYVEGGVAEGRDSRIRNRKEAEAIVDCLAELTTDSAYEGKSMGVIVLQGTFGQVKLLEQLIEQRLPAPVRERHRIRVGTPAQFQGDERHVILLSMVVDRVRRIAGGLRSEQQAYNVAASRAQDQMRLFYSVPPDQLKSGDLRLNLLSYMQNPPAALAEAAEIGVVLPDVRRAPFDSLFEQQVYLRLKQRGYHVVPQYPAGRKRIDLVVVGARGRLGVECDGDYYHSTLDQIRHDQQRDRELQRVGWKFWRIRESEFRFDPDEALAGLWQELDRQGIRPADYSRPNVEPTGDQPWEPLELGAGDDLPDEVTE